MHRVGGLEKQDGTGNVSYDADNHEDRFTSAPKSCQHRQSDSSARSLWSGKGELLVLSWGGTYGACHTAVAEAINDGRSVAHCHLRHMNPLPANLGEILASYESVLVPELNMGQLRMLIRASSWWTRLVSTKFKASLSASVSWWRRSRN